MKKFLAALIASVCALTASAQPQAGLTVNPDTGQILAPPGAVGNFGPANNIPQGSNATPAGTLPVWNGTSWVQTPTNQIGGGSATNLVIATNGTPVVNGFSQINFTGSGVTGASNNGTATINISGGGGGGSGTSTGFTNLPSASASELDIWNIGNHAGRRQLTYTALGDSVTYGSVANPLTNGYAYLIAASNHWALVDRGSPGSSISDNIQAVWTTAYENHSNQVLSLMTGINNSIIDPTQVNAVGSYLDYIGNVALLELQTNKVAGTNMTVVSGSWTTSSNNPILLGYNITAGVFAKAIGASLSAQVYGQNIIVGAMNYVSNGLGGRFTVSIDGTLVATNSTANIFDHANGGVLIPFSHAAWVYTNLYFGPHTVVLTTLDTNYTFIEYAASAEQAKVTAPYLAWFNVIPRLDYTTGGSEAAVDSLNADIANIARLFRYMNFPVGMIDAYSVMRGPTNYFGPDNTHPTNSGHLAIAAFAQRQMSRKIGRVDFPDGTFLWNDPTGGDWLDISQGNDSLGGPAAGFRVSGGIDGWFIKADGSGQMGSPTTGLYLAGWDTSDNMYAPSYTSPAFKATNSGTAITVGPTNNEGAANIRFQTFLNSNFYTIQQEQVGSSYPRNSQFEIVGTTNFGGNYFYVLDYDPIGFTLSLLGQIVGNGSGLTNLNLTNYTGSMSVSNNAQPVLAAYSSQNGFAEIEVQNDSSGSSASSDIVATMNAPFGSESQEYIDMGINSSGFSGAWGSPGDGYLYVQGTNNNKSTGPFTNNLWLGVAQSNGSIIISIGNGGTLTNFVLGSNFFDFKNGFITNVNNLLTQTQMQTYSSNIVQSTNLVQTPGSGFLQTSNTTVGTSNFVGNNADSLTNLNLRFGDRGSNQVAAIAASVASSSGTNFPGVNATNTFVTNAIAPTNQVITDHGGAQWTYSGGSIIDNNSNQNAVGYVYNANPNSVQDMADWNASVVVAQTSIDKAARFNQTLNSGNPNFFDYTTFQHLVTFAAAANMPTNLSAFHYGSPSGVTNGTLGAAVAINLYYTNTFVTRATVTLTLTNSVAAGEIGIYPFTSNAVVRLPQFSSFAAALADTNTLSFNLDPGGYFAVSNLAGTCNVKTNEVQQW